MWSDTVETPKGTSLARNTRFGAWRRKQKKAKKKINSDVTGQKCAQTTDTELPPPKMSCTVGSWTKSTMPSFVKSG